MNTKLLFAIILSMVLIPNAFSQRPRAGVPPPGEGRHGGIWTRGIDANKNGMIEGDEFQAAIDRTFADLDRNGDGTIERNELPHPHPPPPPPMGGQPGPPVIPGYGMRPMLPGQQRDVPPPMGRGGMPGSPDDAHDEGMLPPFFFMEGFRSVETMTRAEFERAAKEVFASMDANHDGVLSREESRPPRDRPEIEERVGPPPNAMFIAAEMRFGDRLVKGQPFSAETAIEDTRRLYDGTTVTKKIKGAFYRDSAGRTRREQPLEMVGGFNIVNEKNKPQTLVFINDFAAKTQYFFDLNNSIARKIGIGPDGPPRDETHAPGAKSESLGTKTIEGISVEGTRVTFEVPAGQVGNDKPIQVVTENWYSPELQLIVMSRHLDPLSGEHIFRLVNLKRSEPAADLFTVPAGFRVESKPDRGPR